MRLIPILENGTVSLPALEMPIVAASVLEATAEMYRRVGFQPPWIGHLALENEVIVGSCGFKGPPCSDEVELAYFTFPGYEGTGVATRMAQALVDLARQANDAPLLISAHTLPIEAASPAILRKLGFTWLGECEIPEDGRVWKWRLNR